MKQIVCKKCGFALQVTGKGAPDYNLKYDGEEFMKKCSHILSDLSIDKSVSVSKLMTNCPHLSKCVTEVLMPDAL